MGPSSGGIPEFSMLEESLRGQSAQISAGQLQTPIPSGHGDTHGTTPQQLAPLTTGQFWWGIRCFSCSLLGLGGVPGHVTVTAPLFQVRDRGPRVSISLPFPCYTLTLSTPQPPSWLTCPLGHLLVTLCTLTQRHTPSTAPRHFQ